MKCPAGVKRFAGGNTGGRGGRLGNAAVEGWADAGSSEMESVPSSKWSSVGAGPSTSSLSSSEDASPVSRTAGTGCGREVGGCIVVEEFAAGDAQLRSAAVGLAVLGFAVLGFTVGDLEVGPVIIAIVILQGVLGSWARAAFSSYAVNTLLLPGPYEGAGL
jgi:hypothetical protein